MDTSSKKTIGIIPNVSGVGGPASFNEKLSAGLKYAGIRVTYDLNDKELSAALVIGGTRSLDKLMSVKNRGIPIIQRLNGMNWVHKRLNLGIKHYLRAEINNWILKTIRGSLATRIVYQSEFSKNWWDRVYGKRNLNTSVIYNGVNTELFHPDEDYRGNEGYLNVLVVEGSFKNGYDLGLRNVISALNTFAGKFTHKVNLIVIGKIDPQTSVELERDVRISINWLGIKTRQEIASQMRNADLFFSADLAPACPNAVIEALASGLPVAAFDSGALGELVTSDCGIISPYDADIWQMKPAGSDAMADLLHSKMSDMSGMRFQARKRAMEEFGLERMVSRYLQVLLG